MNVSSSEVIDAVAAEIKRYMDMTRKEDGFDLSGSYESKRSYSQQKMNPTLSYGKLQDRSLKHYFTPSMIRTHIANLEAVPPGSPREKTVRRRLNRKMKQYAKPVQNENSHFSQKLSEELYTAQLEALSLLHAEAQTRPRRKTIQGQPVLRRSVHPKMTQGEVVRLVNRSSQILVATETVALAHDILNNRNDLSLRPQSAPMSWSNGLPKLYNSSERPKTARGRANNYERSTPKKHETPKYVWDINGRRVRNEEYDDSVEDEPSSSYSVSSSSVDINTHGRHYKGHPRDSRPMSAMALPHNLHVSYSSRPMSAGVSQSQQNFPRPVSRKTLSPDSGFSVDAVTQTRRRRPAPRMRPAFISASEQSSEDEIKLCKYRIEIRTGDRLGASTTADIYLSLHGRDAETDEIYLTNPVNKDKKHKPFKRGQTDVFEIEAEAVGDLQKIGIGHDHKEKGSSWFLDWVKVENDKQSWTFHCKTWLSRSMSKRKTFRHFLLDHSSSESSESDSSSSTSSADAAPKIKPRRVVRRKSSTASSLHSKSSGSSKSRFSSGSESRVVMAPPAVSVQPPTPTSSGHTLVERSDPLHHFSSESSQSSLEYSSDSTVGKGKLIKEDESFVEESEDTRFTTTTSGSDTLTDTEESEEEKTVPTLGASKTPFSVDDLFNFSRDRNGSFSSSSSAESLVLMSKNANKEQKSQEESSSSSEDLSSSSSSEEDAVDSRPKLVKQFSSTMPLKVDLETANYVTPPSLVTADVTTIENPEEENASVMEHELLKPASGSSSSSSSSDEDANSSRESSSDSNEVISKAPRKLSLAESVPLRTESASEIPNFFQNAEADIVTQDSVNKEVEIREEKRLSLSDDSSSANSSRKSSSSSSSDDQDEKTHVVDDKKDEELSREEKAEEKADVFMEGFNAGILATKRLSVTNPLLLEEDTSRYQEIDESLQSDEEGIVQSASHPTIRGDVHNLIKQGETEKVIEIIKLRPELLEKTNENGWSPIHVAATHGKLEILQWLTAQHSNLNTETPTGYTALHMAAMHGHVKCVAVLHAMGADIDARNVDDQTPLHLACMSGHLDTAKWLVANSANILARDNFQRTALDLSKQYQHKEVTQFLKTCLRDLKQRDSSLSLMQSSKSSIDSAASLSSSSSSSSEEDGDLEKTKDDPEEMETDKFEEAPGELEGKKKMYDKQQKKMVRRRSSFLDVIRKDAQHLEKTSSDTDSSSSSSSSSD